MQGWEERARPLDGQGLGVRACGLQEGAGHLRASGLTLCRPQPAFLLLRELREFLEDGHTAAGVQSL